MRAPAVIVIVSIFCISTTVAQDSAAAEPYDLDDAYQIYSLLLPHEESYGFAKGTLVIQEEAVSKPEESGACLTREAANQFKDAIDDYNRLHRKKWLLKRRFQIEKPYEIVSLDTIAGSLQAGWVGRFL